MSGFRNAIQYQSYPSSGLHILRNHRCVQNIDMIQKGSIFLINVVLLQTLFNCTCIEMKEVNYAQIYPQNGMKWFRLNMNLPLRASEIQKKEGFTLRTTEALQWLFQSQIPGFKVSIVQYCGNGSDPTKTLFYFGKNHSRDSF